MSTYERLIATIRAFVEAASWDESRAILKRHPELMTSDVIASLETFAQNAEGVGNAHMAHTFRIHRALLRRCVEVGPAAAFLEMTGAGNEEADDDPDALIQELSDPRAPGGAARKIEVCERLIALFVPEDVVAEELWIGAHVTLAENLLKVADDRVQNRERAVTALESALAVADETRHPEGWAAAHAMLGVVLYERKAGDPAENIERAIRASELSMRVRTRDADPRAWAATANNLASAYLRRMAGDRAVDLEKAIGLLDAALAIRTRDRTPEQWAASELLRRGFVLMVGGLPRLGATESLGGAPCPVVRRLATPALVHRRSVLRRSCHPLRASPLLPGFTTTEGRTRPASRTPVTRRRRGVGRRPLICRSV
jgi:hypothetical protein